MKVILKESIRGLGRVGEVVTVNNAGYARNFLCPQGKAMVVNAENIAAVKAMVAEVEAKEKKEHEAAMVLKNKIEEKGMLSLKVRVKDDGEVYGSIGVTEIQGVLKEQGFDIDRKDIHVIDGPAKSVGEYDVKIDVYHDLQATMKLNIEAEADSKKDD